MLISAFTMVRNADKFYFPIKESICSVLPIAGEVIVALGDNDADDKTEDIIRNINDPKIRILNRKWDQKLFADGNIFAHETTFALQQCIGDWCLYLQADEVLHENDLDIITSACKKYLDDKEVDGLLFDYVHFWGDYRHIVETHGLIRREIRVVRNHIGCYSYKDAVSFRKANNEKLRVVKVPVKICHYGYVRPPLIMGVKKLVQDKIHQGENVTGCKTPETGYNWGPIGGLELFKGTHPAIMKTWIAQFNWADKLNYNKPSLFGKSPHKHLRFKYRLMTWLEKHFNGGEEIFGFKNYILLKREGG